MKQTLLVIAVCLFIAEICCADFGVQIGAFAEQENVNAASTSLRDAGYPVVLEPFVTKDRLRLQIVMAGPYGTKKRSREGDDPTSQVGDQRFCAAIQAATKHSCTCFSENGPAN